MKKYVSPTIISSESINEETTSDVVMVVPFVAAAAAAAVAVAKAAATFNDKIASEPIKRIDKVV